MLRAEPPNIRTAGTDTNNLGYVHLPTSNTNSTLHVESGLELFGLWFFWIRNQSGFTNCETESNPDSVATRFKQSDSCFSPAKYMSSKEPVTFSQ